MKSVAKQCEQIKMELVSIASSAPSGNSTFNIQDFNEFEGDTMEDKINNIKLLKILRALRVISQPSG